jgi:cytochrome c553
MNSLKKVVTVAGHRQPQKRHAALAGGLARSLVVYSRSLALTLLFGASGLALAQAPAKPDLKRGEQIATQVCASCHGADGNSGSPANPKLAGQHSEYLYKQLANFKVKAGAKEAERVNPIMAGFATALSDADMRSVAAYYGGQKLKPAAAKNKELVDLGQRIYRAGIADKGVPACAGCHSPNGAGIPAQYARIGGQYGEYSESQLVAFRQGVRKNSAQMALIASRMSDQEIKAVSDYMAGLR